MDLHIAFTRQVSLSSRPSSKLCVVWFSAGTQSSTFPSSPALASISPTICQRHPTGGVQSWRTSWTPSHNIDSLGMLYESGEIGDLALVTVRLDVPELLQMSARIMNQGQAWSLPEHCCLHLLLPVVPCHGARSEPSIWGHSRCARTQAAEQPS